MSGMLTPLRVLDASYTLTQGRLGRIFAEFGAEIFYLDQKTTGVVTTQPASELIEPAMAAWASKVDVILTDSQSKLSAAYDVMLLQTINPKLIYCTITAWQDLFYVDQSMADLWQALAADPIVKWHLAKRLLLLWQQAQQTLQGRWLEIAELLAQSLQEDSASLGIASRLDVSAQMELSLLS